MGKPSAIVLRKRNKNNNYALLHTQRLNNTPSRNPVKARKSRHRVEISENVVETSPVMETGIASGEGEPKGSRAAEVSLDNNSINNSNSTTSMDQGASDLSVEEQLKPAEQRCEELKAQFEARQKERKEAKNKSKAEKKLAKLLKQEAEFKRELSVKDEDRGLLLTLRRGHEQETYV